MKIIGLAGTNGSGKDTIADLLGEKHGFFVASATNMLAAELEKRGLPKDRVHKRNLSAQWRREHGLAVVVDLAIDQAKASHKDKLIVGSLRHPAEADRVHELGGKVIWVDAEPKIRYERIQKGDRGRIEDQKSFEEFVNDEMAEMRPSGDNATLNMSAVKARADVFIDNSGSDIEVFKTEAVRLLNVG